MMTENETYDTPACLFFPTFSAVELLFWFFKLPERKIYCREENKSTLSTVD